MTEPKPKIDPELVRVIEAAAERAAKRATNRAVRQVLLTLGFNAETPSGVIESQEDAAWIRRVRKASESRPAQYGVVAFSAFMSLIGGLVAIFIKHFLDSVWK